MVARTEGWGECKVTTNSTQLAFFHGWCTLLAGKSAVEKLHLAGGWFVDSCVLAPFTLVKVRHLTRSKSRVMMGH